MPRDHELEVTIQEIEPCIRRRLLLRTLSTFAHRHDASQVSFGWQNDHLREFRLPRPPDRVPAGPLGLDNDDWERRTPDGRRVKRNSYFVGKWALEWCEYEYDFGDSWVHEVKFIGVHSIQETFKRRLLDGARAGPPEDAGGPGG